MFIVENYQIAVVFCVVTMLCWGSWANTTKLAGGGWRFELFYWDYVLGVVLCSLLFAFTLGSMGEAGRPFMTDLQQADSGNLLSAFLGGVVFNLANILVVAAISIAGMSVAFPVGIGLALVVGVAVNYLQNQKGDPVLLAIGVALVVAAIVLDAIAYRRLPGQNKSVSTLGLGLALAGGLLMGFFYLLVARTMDGDNFATPASGTLTPYTAFVLFSLGMLASNFVFNTVIMRMPVAGEPVSMVDYFRGTAFQHGCGVLGGLIWGVAMVFNIIASGTAGPAISYGLGQGATMVAACWGVFVWREFRGASKSTQALLALMFLAFLAGLGTIIVAGKNPDAEKNRTAVSAVTWRIPS